MTLLNGDLIALQYKPSHSDTIVMVKAESLYLDHKLTNNGNGVPSSQQAINSDHSYLPSQLFV